jgi:hypothetical protein
MRGAHNTDLVPSRQSEIGYKWVFILLNASVDFIRSQKQRRYLSN